MKDELRENILNHLSIISMCSTCPLSEVCPKEAAYMNWGTMCKNTWEENLINTFGDKML